MDGNIAATCKSAVACAQRRGTGVPISQQGPAGLRPLIRRLHGEHRKLGGTRKLPALEALTTHLLQQLAAELERANRLLRGGAPA